MAEKKETQWAVVKQSKATNVIYSIMWFDSREEARAWRRRLGALLSTKQGIKLVIYPMKRGPRA